MHGKSDNVLAVSARIATNKNWTLLDFSSDESALWYTHVLSDLQRMNQATSRASLFPFPPEAVAHIAFMFDDFLLANRKHMEQLEKDNAQDADQAAVVSNVFAEAMLYMGESIRLEDFQHKQPSLTDCAIRDGREIPCITFQHGFLFTISFSNGELTLKQCTGTHNWTAICQDKEYKPFLPLPLVDEQEEGVTMPSAQFCHVFRHGLCFANAVDGSAIVTVDIGYKPNCKRLPFYMFPVTSKLSTIAYLKCVTVLTSGSSKTIQLYAICMQIARRFCLLFACMRALYVTKHPMCSDSGLSTMDRLHTFRRRSKFASIFRTTHSWTLACSCRALSRAHPTSC
jgi:hypothetical protein